MPTALEKLLALSAAPAAPVALSPADEMVLAAQALTDDLHVLLLAWSDDDDDSDSKSKGKSGGGGNKDGDDDDDGDDEYAAMVAKLVKKGIPKARAQMMAKQAMKRVKATALAEGIAVALSALSVPPGASLEAVRGRMAAASRTWQPSPLALTSGAVDEHVVRLAVLTAEQRKKSSAHTIPGSDDYPIPDKGHLSAALARYKQGALAGHSKEEVRKHILSRAKALGEEVDLVAA